MLLCACTPCHRVHAHHTIVCACTTSCACTPRHHVHAHHIVCVHMTLCTPHHGVHFSQISLQSHVTTHLSQSEGSILSNLSDLVRNCEISPKIFPPFKEQSCYNSSAKKLSSEIFLIFVVTLLFWSYHVLSSIFHVIIEWNLQ